MNIADLPPLEELVPHRGMSLLLNRVLAYDGTKTTCSIGLEDQAWLKNADGRIANGGGIPGAGSLCRSSRGIG